MFGVYIDLFFPLIVISCRRPADTVVGGRAVMGEKKRRLSKGKAVIYALTLIECICFLKGDFLMICAS